MKNKCNNRELRWLLVVILVLGLGSASLNAQSIQAIAGTFDVTGEPNSGGFSGGFTTGQLLIPFVDRSGSTAGLVWFSPGDGSLGYVHCAVSGASCTLAEIMSITDVLFFNASLGDSAAGTFWNALSGNASCLHGGGTVTKTTFQSRLDKTTGVLTVRGTGVVSGLLLNYPFEPGFGDCDTSSLIASYTISGKANYRARFTLDPQSEPKAYIFQWMHISFNR